MKLFFSTMFWGVIIGLITAGIYLTVYYLLAFIYLSALAGFCFGFLKPYRLGSYLTIGYGLAWLIIIHDFLQSLLMSACFFAGFSLLYALLYVLGFKKPKTPKS